MLDKLKKALQKSQSVGIIAATVLGVCVLATVVMGFFYKSASNNTKDPTPPASDVQNETGDKEEKKLMPSNRPVETGTHAIAVIDDETVEFKTISDWTYGDTVKFTADGKNYELPNTDVVIIDYAEGDDIGYWARNATEFHQPLIHMFDNGYVKEDIYHTEEIEECETHPATRLYSFDKTYYVAKVLYDYQTVVHDDTGSYDTETGNQSEGTVPTQNIISGGEGTTTTVDDDGNVTIIMTDDNTPANTPEENDDDGKTVIHSSDTVTITIS